MKNNLKPENIEKTDKNGGTSRSVSPVTNPSGKNSKPVSSSKAASKPAGKSKTKAKTVPPLNIPAVNPAPDNNPILRNREIVAKINNINTVKSSNKMYGGYLTNTLSSQHRAVDYADVVRELNISLQNKKTLNDLFNSIHNVFSEKLHCSFTAFGMFHEKSKCINLKLFSTMGSTYSSKIFLSESDNPVIECFTSASAVIQNTNAFLNIPYMKNTSTIILPLVSLNQTVGVMILGKEDPNCNIGIIYFIANYAAMLIHIFDLR